LLKHLKGHFAGDLVELYMSPVETYCRNLDYYIPEEGRTKNLTGEEMTRIRKFFMGKIHENSQPIA
jgi:hypothetical protein